MRRRLTLLLACLGSLAAARPAGAVTSLTLEGFGGIQSLRFTRESVANAVLGREGTALVGGDALFDLNGLGLGIGADKTLQSNGPEPWAVFVNAGFLIDVLPSMRIEALGELGRRGFDSLGDFTFKDTNPNFNTYIGLRPGVSVRLLPSPLRVGVSGLVRWRFHNDGSPDYGAIARLGLDLG